MKAGGCHLRLQLNQISLRSARRVRVTFGVDIQFSLEAKRTNGDIGKDSKRAIIEGFGFFGLFPGHCCVHVDVEGHCALHICVKIQTKKYLFVRV